MKAEAICLREALSFGLVCWDIKSVNWARLQINGWQHCW